MRSIDIRGANDPPKSAKVLAGQGHGLMIYYREKNEAEAGLIKIYAYKIGENVKRFEEKF